MTFKVCSSTALLKQLAPKNCNIGENRQLILIKNGRDDQRGVETVRGDSGIDNSNICDDPCQTSTKKTAGPGVLADVHW